MSIVNSLPANYQALCLKKWTPLLESNSFDAIADQRKRETTAMVLESTCAEFERKIGKKALTESVSSAGSNGVFGVAGDYAKGDARMPSIVIPTIRRAFPNLIAHDVCGVQPMNGPVGFAFALRALYGDGGKGGASGVAAGTELGYNTIDAGFTGASGSAPAFTSSSEADEAWEAFAGASVTPTVDASGSLKPAKVYNPAGTGAATGDAEWWKFGQTMPMVDFKLIKETITAESRKLGANWSMELEEDMAAMQGIDVRGEFVDMIGYELQQQIDRQLLGRMVASALECGNVSTWTPVTADGRNQQERISTFYTEMIRRANDVAVRSRRGAANFAFGSPNVCSIFAATVFNPNSTAGFKADEKGLLTQNGVAKVGTFVQGGITLYRDTFATGDYMLLGYKGQTQYDAGIIYCPYIPLSLKEMPGSDDMNPRLMIRTRYGCTQNLLASGNYFHVVNVKQLSDAVTPDGTSGRKFFM